MPVSKSPPLFWAPDKDPSWAINPGVLTELMNLVPTMRGTLANYACTPGENFNLVPSTLTLPATRPSSAVLLKQGSTTTPQQARLIIGAGEKLLEAKAGAQNVSDPPLGGGIFDVSNLAASYSGGEWCFCAYGDLVIATLGAFNGAGSGGTLPQVSSAILAPFTNIGTGTISGAVCTVNQGHLVLGNISDGTNTFGDGWACSGLHNLQGTGSWVPSLTSPANLATGANYGRLLDTPGTIRAFVNMRDMIVAYKVDSIYIGRRTGNPLTWSWTLVAEGVGQSNANGVAVVAGVHYFLHRTGVYRFDGASAQDIGRGIVNSFVARKMQAFGTFDPGNGPRAVVDDQRNLIFWYVSVVDVGRSIGKSALVLNYVTGQFGWVEDSWSDNGTSPTVGFCCPVRGSREDAMLWSSAVQFYPGILTVGQDAAGVVTLRVPVIGASSLGAQTRCGFATGDIGDEENVTTLTAIKPRLVVGDGDMQFAECVVDGKMAQADYFEDEGFHLRGITTTTAGTAALTSIITTTSANGIAPYTVAAGDYLAFDFKVLEGNGVPATPCGIRVNYAAPSAGVVDYLTQYIVRPGIWQMAYMDISADIGRVTASFFFMIGDTSTVGNQRVIFRRVRITNSTGDVRRRIWNAGEERVPGGAFTAQTNITGVRPFGGYKAFGQRFTYDRQQRRFQGAVAWRWHRATIALYNRADIAALELDVSGSGKE